MAAWKKLGIIAGGGELPVMIAEYCRASGQAYFVCRIRPWADASLEDHPGVTRGLGMMAGRIADMQTAGCDAVVIVGQVPRPDFSTLELDEGALVFAQRLRASAARGDDPLLRALVEYHAENGFQVIGAEDAMPDLKAGEGAYGAHAPAEQNLADIKLAARVANATGAFDIGQAVVVANNLVLGVEAQEGTDALLRRVAELPETVRGTLAKRRGVLLKRPKPMQERRIDLPVIGLRTLEGVAAAGLAGIAIEAGGALIVGRAALIKAADEAGLFIYGFNPALGET
ncbi:MAG: UDP-2,3-diacylglucosamine diphosphatase LpxI [Alphaproteobacteria bacterium]